MSLRFWHNRKLFLSEDYGKWCHLVCFLLLLQEETENNDCFKKRRGMVWPALGQAKKVSFQDSFLLVSCNLSSYLLFSWSCFNWKCSPIPTPSVNQSWLRDLLFIYVETRLILKNTFHKIVSKEGQIKIECKTFSFSFTSVTNMAWIT